MPKKGMMKKIRALERMDKWTNAASGFGGAKDPITRMYFNSEQILTKVDFESLYRFDWLARKAVEVIPKDALREGITFKTDEKETVTGISNDIDTFKLIHKVNTALNLSRLYGGSVIVIGANDGQEITEPLNMDGIKEIKYFTVLDRYQVEPEKYYADPLVDNYNEPMLYRLQPINSSGTRTNSTANQRIHESRLIRFDGAYLPDSLKVANKGWHDSILIGINEALKNYGVASQSGAQLIHDFVAKVLKIPDLVELLSCGKEALLETRLQYAIANLSNLGIVLIGEGEEFSKVQNPIGGLPQMIDKYVEFVSAATDIPRTRLFGQQLGTLSGAGEATRNYYDSIKAYQKNSLQDPFEQLLTLLLKNKSGPTNGKEPEDWSFEFNPLWQETEKEIVDKRAVQATTDSTYVTIGVLDPAEVATSRFGPEGYSIETTIDHESRKEPDDGPPDDKDPDDEPGGVTLPNPE